MTANTVVSDRLKGFIILFRRLPCLPVTVETISVRGGLIKTRNSLESVFLDCGEGVLTTQACQRQSYYATPIGEMTGVTIQCARPLVFSTWDRKRDSGKAKPIYVSPSAPIQCQKALM